MSKPTYVLVKLTIKTPPNRGMYQVWQQTDYRDLMKRRPDTAWQLVAEGPKAEMFALQALAEAANEQVITR